MVLPEVSDVALTEDILKDKPPFVFSYYEWLREKGEQIILSVFGTGATIYTIPEGSVLFINSCFVTAYAGSGSGIFRIGGAFDEATLLKTRSDVSLPESSSLSFPIPIRVDSGNTIVHESGGTGNAGFSGFLVKKSDLIFT